jgi:uncharacterized protein YjbJ (UPF0337 family)
MVSRSAFGQEIAPYREGVLCSKIKNREEGAMNWDQVEGNWRQLKGKAKQQWGKLTDDELEEIAGHKEELVGKLQERYGIARQEAEKQADQWRKAC